MSDLDDMLLAMAEPGERKRKVGKSSKSKGSSSKRPRPAPVELDSASDMDMSTDEEEEVPLSGRKTRKADDDESGDDDDRNPYPLEGKYIDSKDRDDIQAMTEIERETVLGTRAEKQNAKQQRNDLRMMVQAKEREAGGGAAGDSPARGGGRDRTQTGTTSAKRDTLQRLKQSRERKGKKSEATVNDDDDEYDESSSRRQRNERAYSDESEEEGEVEAAFAAPVPSKKGKKGKGEPAVQADFKDVQVTRSKLAEFCGAPWFTEWVTGAWVRYLIGKDDQGDPTYRLCQVVGVKEEAHRPYKFENAKTDLLIELKFANSSKTFTMEGVSNSPFTDREFNRLTTSHTEAKVPMPSQNDVHKVRDQLAKHKDYIMTEADVAALLAKKGGTLKTAQGRAKLLIQRDFARSTGNAELETSVLAKLAELEAPPPVAGTETEADRMTKVNEKNRASNRAVIKKAESRNQDARMKQSAALARGDLDVKVDASARVKTMPRMNFDSNQSLPGTPLPGTPNNGLAGPIAGTPSRAKQSKYEEMVASRVQVDIDLDF